MCLDKDLLHKGNKIYSPETCVFVPQRINTLICNRALDRGNYPIGVTFKKGLNKYNARCNVNNERIDLGVFLTEIEAFNTYKHFKESLIKEMADKYKNKIPKILYDAMYKYEININD